MPNYVKNIITVKGESSELEFAQNFLQHLDFDVLLPKSKTLNINTGSIDRFADAAFIYQLYGERPLKSIESGVSKDIINLVFPNWITDYDSKIKELKSYMKNNYPEPIGVSDINILGVQSEDISYLYDGSEGGKDPKSCADLAALGEIRYRNRILYGSANWYDWNIENWGTKWNAMYLCCKKDGNQVVCTFETAWSFPYGIGVMIEKILGATNLDITWVFADEDIGHNCGVYTKTSIQNEFKFEDKEGDFKFACEVFGIDAQDYENM